MVMKHTEEFRREAVRIALEQRFVARAGSDRFGDQQVDAGTLGFAVSDNGPACST